MQILIIRSFPHPNCSFAMLIGIAVLDYDFHPEILFENIFDIAVAQKKTVTEMRGTSMYLQSRVRQAYTNCLYLVTNCSNKLGQRNW